MKVDLGAVLDMLQNASLQAGTLHETEVGAPDHGNPAGAEHRRQRAHDAQVSRDLLFLRHTLETAAMLVANEYFACRGQDTGLDAIITPTEEHA